MTQFNTGIFYESSKVPRLKKYDQLVIFYDGGDILNYIIKQSKDAGHIYLCDPSKKLEMAEATRLNRISNVAYLPNARLSSYISTKSGKLAGIVLEDGAIIHCTKVLILKGE